MRVSQSATLSASREGRSASETAITSPMVVTTSVLAEELASGRQALSASCRSAGAEKSATKRGWAASRTRSTTRSSSTAWRERFMIIFFAFSSSSARGIHPMWDEHPPSGVRCEDMELFL